MLLSPHCPTLKASSSSTNVCDPGLYHSMYVCRLPRLRHCKASWQGCQRRRARRPRTAAAALPPAAAASHAPSAPACLASFCSSTCWMRPAPWLRQQQQRLQPATPIRSIRARRCQRTTALLPLPRSLVAPRTRLALARRAVQAMARGRRAAVAEPAQACLALVRSGPPAGPTAGWHTEATAQAEPGDCA